MIGVELVKDKETKKPATNEAERVCRKAYKKGLVLIPGGIYESVLRISPPLIITEEEADIGFDIIEESISEVERGN